MAKPYRDPPMEPISGQEPDALTDALNFEKRKTAAKKGAAMKTCATCPNKVGCMKAGKCAKTGKPLGMMKGGKVKGYKGGGELKMVEKNGKQVPFYAADGVGKMKAGGKVKGYKEGKMVKKGTKKVRGAGCAQRGVRPAKMR